MQRISFSIIFKLMLFVLPLVCLPVAIVGYLSYQASVESVTRLSREEQLLQARTAATEINTIFESCCRDLDTLAGFLTEHLEFATLSFDAMPRPNQDNMLELFRKFSLRSPYYLHVYLSPVVGNAKERWRPGKDGTTEFQQPLGDGSVLCRVGKITYSETRKGYVTQFSRPLAPAPGERAWELCIDIDFDKVIELVRGIRVGENGFAFLTDQSGRTIAHPLYKPLQYDLTKYDDPRLREFVVDMITGETGWKTYFHLGEQAAAYAPIDATGWSLAVSIPIDEFKREARILRGHVMQLVIVVLIMAVAGCIVLSYHLIKPVRDLAMATDRIAGGDLKQEIPVRSSDELGALTHSFNRMVRNLREIQTKLVRSEKLISMGRLSSGIAHEVRNPLNAMKGALVYLQQLEPGDETIPEYIEIILDEIERIDKFVTEFLYFARQSPPSVEKTDINELIGSLMDFLKKEFKRKGIEIRLQPLKEPPELMLDPGQIEQVFLNLFVNSMQAMPDGGVLHVSMEMSPPETEDGDRPGVSIFVQDNGIGIGSEQLSNIFDPYFTTKKTGTGLGLPISLGIVENHGGTMKIESVQGSGTIVTVSLPPEGGKPSDPPF